MPVLPLLWPGNPLRLRGFVHSYNVPGMANQHNSRDRHRLIALRVTTSELAELKSRARDLGATLSDYLRGLASLPTGDARSDLRSTDGGTPGAGDRPKSKRKRL